MAYFVFFVTWRLLLIHIIRVSAKLYMMLCRNVNVRDICLLYFQKTRTLSYEILCLILILLNDLMGIILQVLITCIVLFALLSSSMVFIYFMYTKMDNNVNLFLELTRFNPKNVGLLCPLKYFFRYFSIIIEKLNFLASLLFLFYIYIILYTNDRQICENIRDWIYRVSLRIDAYKNTYYVRTPERTPPIFMFGEFLIYFPYPRLIEVRVFLELILKNSFISLGEIIKENCLLRLENLINNFNLFNLKRIFQNLLDFCRKNICIFKNTNINNFNNALLKFYEQFQWNFNALLKIPEEYQSIIVILKKVFFNYDYIGIEIDDNVLSGISNSKFGKTYHIESSGENSVITQNITFQSTNNRRVGRLNTNSDLSLASNSANREGSKTTSKVYKTVPVPFTLTPDGQKVQNIGFGDNNNVYFHILPDRKRIITRDMVFIDLAIEKNKLLNKLFTQYNISKVKGKFLEHYNGKRFYLFPKKFEVRFYNIKDGPTATVKELISAPLSVTPTGIDPYPVEVDSLISAGQIDSIYMYYFNYKQKYLNRFGNNMIYEYGYYNLPNNNIGQNILNNFLRTLEHDQDTPNPIKSNTCFIYHNYSSELDDYRFTIYEINGTGQCYLGLIPYGPVRRRFEVFLRKSSIVGALEDTTYVSHFIIDPNSSDLTRPDFVRKYRDEEDGLYNKVVKIALTPENKLSKIYEDNRIVRDLINTLRENNLIYYTPGRATLTDININF